MCLLEIFVREILRTTFVEIAGSVLLAGPLIFSLAAIR